MHSMTTDGFLLEVFVSPNARRTEILGRHGDGLKIRVAAPPEHGKANTALLQFLKTLPGMVGTHCEIVSGHHHKRKLVRIVGSPPEVVASWLGELAL